MVLLLWSQISVGVSPPILDLGEINPGESKIARFYIITSSKEKMLVYLGSSKGNINIFKKPQYTDYLKYYSEEDTSSWIEFVDNPMELIYLEKKPENLKNDINLEQFREVKFIINVPKNAEPGYHTGFIEMDPVPPQSGKADISVKSIVPLTYIFKVKGDAIRSGRIIDIFHYDYSFDRRWVKVLYQNDGTVTTFVNQGKIEIFDDDGKLILEKPTTGGYVKPNEIFEFDSFIDPKEIEDGEYNVRVTFDYNSGNVSRDLVLNLGFLKGSTVKAVETKKEFKIPWTIIILLVIIIISYIIYKG